METLKHYDEHLAEYYTWMSGGFENKNQEAYNFFKENSIIPFSNKSAYDFGAGCGFQTLALAKLGFNVTAVDFSIKLIEELKTKVSNYNIKILKGDILNAVSNIIEPCELIICMGDTIAHFSDKESLKKFIFQCYAKQIEGGKIVLTLRDQINELKNEERFIPVKSDDNTIFTCFLEYFDDYIKVYDIINIRKNNQWIQKISSYIKIRLTAEQVISYLENAGYKITKKKIERGLVTLIGTSV
ncbi:MAG TPA: class I SAM-dependent methyltransferase [bacterium]|nr:class I SAM-dependent methyltransferase [bacterium]HPN29733.1 class I SAM-dependent methyltransferase [bacterium]